MIIVGIIFLTSMGFSNSSGDRFKFISNIEIVVIDNRINGYLNIYESESNFYEQSFPLPGIQLYMTSNDLKKSGYDEVVCLTSTIQRLNLEYIDENGSMHTCPIYITVDEPGFTILFEMQRSLLFTNQKRRNDESVCSCNVYCAISKWLNVWHSHSCTG